MAHNKNRISHKKELYYVLCIAATIVILLVSFLGRHGYPELRKAQLKLQEQHRRVEELRRSNEDRNKKIEGLRSDKEAQEKYAREKGYGRVEDIIFQLPSQPEEKSK
jgi:cell division protein FtsB